MGVLGYIQVHKLLAPSQILEFCQLRKWRGPPEGLKVELSIWVGSRGAFPLAEGGFSVAFLSNVYFLHSSC